MEAHIITIGDAVMRHLSNTSGVILFLEFIQIFSAYLILDGIRIFLVMRYVSRKGTSYSRVDESYAANILIAGDSTAVGTGAKNPEHTLAGFLAHDFPKVNIINVAINGARTYSVLNQLTHAHDKKYDMIMISTGGNDVWTFTPLSKLRADLIRILSKAKEMSNNKVVVIFFGNEGSAPFFPFLLRPFLMWRTKKINNLFLDVTHHEKVFFIQLFTDPKGNPFVRQPEVFFAADGLHPNDAGYWEWYKKLWSLMVDGNFLFRK